MNVANEDTGVNTVVPQGPFHTHALNAIVGSKHASNEPNKDHSDRM